MVLKTVEKDCTMEEDIWSQTLKWNNYYVYSNFQVYLLPIRVQPLYWLIAMVIF